MLSKVIRAQRINRLSGGAVITPWDVDDLSDEWLDLFHALDNDAKDIRASKARVESVFNRFRDSHPTYNKRMS